MTLRQRIELELGLAPAYTVAERLEQTFQEYIKEQMRELKPVLLSKPGYVGVYEEQGASKLVDLLLEGGLES